MRRTHDKYKTERACHSILKQKCPEIGKLLELIESKLYSTEKIEISQWCNDWYYVIIEDSRFAHLGYPANAVCGFTVNINKDIVMFNNDTSDNANGGNCFLRSEKWKRIVNKNLNANSDMFHFYKANKF